jgi:hypothetical protein
MIYENLDEFMNYWKGINPNESIDYEEALEIFFNQETYNEAVI